MNLFRLFLTLCAYFGATAQAQILLRGNDGDPETLDHHGTSTIAESRLMDDLYSGLVDFSPTAEVVPGTAERWDLSDDGLTYVFYLREDAAWSNGDPVTAHDFVFAFRRLMDPLTSAKYATILYPIKKAEQVNTGELPPSELGVRAIDDRTLEIRLETATPYFLDQLTHQTGKPLHQASVEAFGDQFVKPENMVTNGAYKLESSTLNARIVLRKNEYFYDADKVAIEEVHYIPFEDRSTCVRAWEAEEVHICTDLPAQDLRRLEQYGDSLRVVPYLGTYYYALNTQDEFLSDPEIRLAMSLVIDREFLADEIWPGMIPATSLVPVGINNYPGGSPTLDIYNMSMLDREDEAMAIMARKGITKENPVHVELMYNSGENHKNTATAIADMWSEIGLKVTFKIRDAAAHYAYLRDKGPMQVARAGWIGDYSDPQNFLFLLESYNDGFNYARYDNPEYDAIMVRAANELDLDVRAEILREAEAIVLRDTPFLPIYYYSSFTLVSPRIEGYESNVMNKHLSRYLTLVD
ncbi:ABC oligopeptide transporter, perplasmic substrate-binding protein OppA [Parvularcula bermudensis HTCC2503]|uniref:ABC oligopeptide transporter, perplasmic substrate-binding protein OppA n=1 Tax=Parvularcula bermudensis (strain ATCC BAA-594 / HTCC2503 / KCTC 12087) TaxID=314260 RepID=E0TEV5_PARBH|nr:peptide ABC transporter substrate-binding protein [Parvularcula bermudensis]ADM09527.1 ABC oligopeptide transporter, perplasmic substrate-binding protein OppA [Parvularcula bermudensis HTCC2503]